MQAKQLRKLTLEFGREGEYVTARCIELGTASFGDTYIEAVEAICEAVALHVRALAEAYDPPRTPEGCVCPCHQGPVEGGRCCMHQPIQPVGKETP